MSRAGIQSFNRISPPSVTPHFDRLSVNMEGRFMVSILKKQHKPFAISSNNAVEIFSNHN
jgi:hypothetical protein